jgi:hypothetical protein
VTSYAIANATYGAYGTFLDITQPGAAATAVPPGVFNTAGFGFCAAGQLAVAGGATKHDQTNGFISSVSAAPGGQYWLVTGTNINPPTSYSEFFLPTAVCVPPRHSPTPPSWLSSGMTEPYRTQDVISTGGPPASNGRGPCRGHAPPEGEQAE